MLTEFKIASFRRLAFWNKDLDELEMVEGGPEGGNEGVDIIGDEIEEPPADPEPVYERRPDELELAEPRGRGTEVVLRVTVRLIDFAFSAGAGSAAAPVNVNVKYGTSSIAHADTIMLACSGLSFSFAPFGCVSFSR